MVRRVGSVGRIKNALDIYYFPLSPHSKTVTGNSSLLTPNS
jgi:hypothetical protein